MIATFALLAGLGLFFVAWMLRGLLIPLIVIGVIVVTCSH